MYSTTSEDLSRDHLALQVTNCLKKIVENHKTVTPFHKELVEIDLSFTAYIEESRNRLKNQRLNLARQAKSSQEVVEILSEKSLYSVSRIQTMSNSPATPSKQNNITKSYKLKTYKEDNNNATNKFTERQQARTFIAWYKRMIDHERQNLGLYLSDDSILEWFGRTIKTRKKVQSFLRYDMQCSRHYFTTIESIDKVQLRHERIVNKRKDDTILASPLHSPELISSKSSAKKRLLRSNCNSPEWEEGCNPDDVKSSERKRLKIRHIESLHDQHNSLKRGHPEDVSSKGDGISERRPKQKCIAVTPPNHELGQGDCLPSTSDNTASHEALNAQLPKLAVECNGYIEFTRSRNNRSSDSMKWERKCKVQISYSEDPLNVGEYIIWSLHYIDETKCRRNLMAAFEAVAKEESNVIK